MGKRERQVNRQLELVSAKGKSVPGPNEVFIHLISASEAQWFHLGHTPPSTQHARRDGSATQMILISTKRKTTQICLMLAQKYQHWILNKYIIKILEIGKKGLLGVAFTNMDTRKGQPVTKGEYCPEVRTTDSSLSHS